MPHDSSPDGVPIVMRCAWCTLYAVEERWVPEESALGRGGRSSVVVTHGICPPCATEVQRAAAATPDRAPK